MTPADPEKQSNPLSRSLGLFKDIFLETGKIWWTEDKIAQTPVGQKRLYLFLTSFLILFVELALIRWIPANVRYMGFFLNFILLAVFLGIGIGILSARHTRLWLPSFPLTLLILALTVGRNVFVLNIPSAEVLYYGISEHMYESESFFILPLMVLLVAVTIIPLSRSLGKLLVSLPPLEAYGVDILGSLAGIAVFFLISYFSLQPILWFGLAALIYFILRPKRELVLSFPLFLGVIYVVNALAAGCTWSPYYQICPSEVENGTYISVNGIGHQFAVANEYKENFYFKVYEIMGEAWTYENVLIIGAGTGSDVAIALESNTENVTAVEIDPIIYQIGVDKNPDRPYSDPRVQVTVNDGRFFLNNTDEKFDLIVFGLPDSLTLTSGFSSLRLESFLLTTESFQAARDRLTDDGVLVLYNYYREAWLVRKLAGMLEEVFGTTPYVTTYGDYGKAAVLMVGKGLTGVRPYIDQDFTEGFNSSPGEHGLLLPVFGEGRLGGQSGLDLSTDDWPFVYMPQRTMPLIFSGAFGIVLAMSLGLLYLVAPRTTKLKFDWHFFFLGVAFMLLETRSLVTFALLFGTTWMVNSLVFFAILSSVLLAILVNAKLKIKRVNLLYVLLILSIFANFILPVDTFIHIENIVARYLVVSALAFLPIFLANIVFTRSFRDTHTADIAFGSNLLGAMVGGMLEYVALVSGYQALLLVALGAYLLAYLTFRTLGYAAE